MAKIKVAVVGVGNISNCHINGYLKNENVELYAFCDINEERVKAQGAKYGVTRLYTDEATMLAECPEIDAVSVCTWNSAHAPCTIMALNAGKHVLCEKPMAMNAQEAQDMIDASVRNGKKLMIGFVRRFGNDASVVKDFIENDKVGDIYYAKATYLRRNGNPGGWFGDKSRSGGGPLIDLGVHVIDLTRFLMGNPKPVSVYGATFHKLGNRPGVKSRVGYVSASRGSKDICDVEDMATALIRYDNGAVLSVEASFSLNIKNDSGKIELFGTKGGVKLDPEFELYTDVNNYLANVTLNMPTALSFDGLFENEINYFVNAVVNDVDVSSIARDGKTLMQILDAIYLSAKEQREVLID
ncbi:MAG: Gfo/Idh/MocA family oxidoreductase [Clostridia bacterium]|nr:Gfo/Idh/MocA family oxidoreductase [Clostridia bacterium]